MMGGPDTQRRVSGHDHGSTAMTPGPETALATDPSVDPVVLAVMLVAFLVGAVGPFALCVIGSIRDERAMRRYAAGALAANEAASAETAVGNPVDPGVVPAAVTLNPSTLDVDGMEPANDDADAPALRAVTGG